MLTKLGRMMYNNKRQIPFNDEINRFKKTHISPIQNVKIVISHKGLGQIP